MKVQQAACLDMHMPSRPRRLHRINAGARAALACPACHAGRAGAHLVLLQAQALQLALLALLLLLEPLSLLPRCLRAGPPRRGCCSCSPTAQAGQPAPGGAMVAALPVHRLAIARRRHLVMSRAASKAGRGTPAGRTAAPSGLATCRRSATTASAFCLRDTRSCCCSSHSLRSLALMPAVRSVTSSAAHTPSAQGRAHRQRLLPQVHPASRCVSGLQTALPSLAWAPPRALVS